MKNSADDDVHGKGKDDATLYGDVSELSSMQTLTHSHNQVKPCPPEWARYGLCSWIGPDGTLWTVGGGTEGGAFARDCLRFDTHSKLWLTPVQAQVVGQAVDQVGGPTCNFAGVSSGATGPTLLFGGKANGYQDGLWMAPDPAQPQRWQPVARNADDPWPDARWGHSMVRVGPEGRHVCVFGGFDAMSSASADVWVLDVTQVAHGTASWTRLRAPEQEDGPAPRFMHTAMAVEHSQHGPAMIVLGGTTGAHSLNDVWLLTGDVTAEGDGGVHWVCLSRDTAGHGTLAAIGDAGGHAPKKKEKKPGFFARRRAAKGGSSGSGASQQVHDNVPAARFGHAGFALGDFVYMFGGMDKASDTVFGDFWRFHVPTSSWSRIQLMGCEQLSARYHHSFVVDTDTHTLYLIGGRGADHELLPRLEYFSVSVLNQCEARDGDGDVDAHAVGGDAQALVHIERVPNDVLALCLDYLSPKCLVACTRVNKRFHALASNSWLWIRHVQADWALMHRVTALLSGGESCHVKINYYDMYRNHRNEILRQEEEARRRAEAQRLAYEESQARARKSYDDRAARNRERHEAKELITLKVVHIGDGAVGKTCFCIAYTTNAFPGEYIPTVFDNYAYYHLPHVHVGLWDTAGPEDYDRLRPLSYPQTDVFLILFSMVNRASLANIATKWYPEISHHCPGVPFILVGTKMDLLNDEATLQRLRDRGSEPVTEEMAQQMADRLGAAGCIFTSALEQVNLVATYDLVFQCCITPSNRRGASSGPGCVLA